MLARLRDEVRAMTFRQLVRAVVAAFDRNDLLTFASAIAFQVFFALIPLALFALGLLGGFGLGDAWTRNAAPDLQDKMSPAAFQVLDQTVRRVLEERQVFWVSIGAVLTVWKMSGAARAVMDVFDRIYDVDSARSSAKRYLVSVVLSLAAGTLILGAVATVNLGPQLLGGPLGLLRWPIALVLLLATIAVLVRYAPSERRPTGWVTFGALLVVLAWIGTSLVFAAYLTHVADYGSAFGALATVFVALQYLVLAAVAFLTGAQLDALIAERLEGNATGHAVAPASDTEAVVARFGHRGPA